VAHWLFTIYHDIRVEGAEHVPDTGAVIIAANHPTYLDPAFLMVGMQRSIQFMAWEKPFRLPFIGALMRAYGSIPVDMKKPGRGSFIAALKVLRQGNVFGIFPEGGRTKQARQMNPVKSGVARLAVITGAPIVPVTILGGRRVWRRGTLLPRPGPIRVVFHPPVHIPKSARADWRRDRQAEGRIISELLATINRKLLPSMRAEERMRKLLRKAAPQTPAIYVDGIPVAYLAAMWWFLPEAARWNEGLISLKWILAYLTLLGLELLLEARGWVVKWIRHLLPWLTLAGVVHGTIGLPPAFWFGVELGVLAGLVWCTIFRFPLYRRVRTLLLVVGYGSWLMHLLKSVTP
jgi:1-acyl-sn-glycerol-3-phosphate acyltransferase